MKILVSLTLSVLFTIEAASAQNISFKLLKDIANCTDYNCFKYLVPGGQFSFYDEQPSGNGKVILYRSITKDTTKSDWLKYSIFTVPFYDTIMSSVTFVTYDLEYFNKIIAQMKSEQFTVTDDHYAAIIDTKQTTYHSPVFPKNNIITEIIRMIPDELTRYAIHVRRLK